MAGGTITRVASVGFTSDSETYLEDFNEIVHSSETKVAYNAEKQHHLGDWEEIPVGTHFKKGGWTDDKDKPIKKAYIGDTIRFHIETKDVKDGDEVTFTVYDWDGMLNLDDKLSLVIQGTSNPYNKITIKGNKGIVEWTTGSGTQKLIEEEGDNEVELYVSCSYKGEVIELPYNMDDYLIIYEKEVKITVFVELPHSKETGWGAKGLAGHSAMAIGEKYFDYGPNNTPGIYSESQYDVDFNEDGDKDDNVRLDNPTFKNSPGQPWWGTHIADKKGIKPEEVTLDMVLDHIKLHWERDGTYIYGKVHTIEFYVKESEAKKMINWWEERYKHLKVYSVFPWTGEQCTTTVKAAIQEVFSKSFITNYIPDVTQTPKGLLQDLQAFVSTSKEHSGQLAKITVIKEEAADFQK
ncbi:hypothetical protein OA88_02770 [Flavobacterium sp. JRM]|nr:hypothetical protein OA88_02770 [Flavobacterium sp. JRM]